MSDRRPRVVCTEPIDRAGLDLLRAESDLVALWERPGESLRDHLADVEGLVVRVLPIDRTIVEAAPRLRVIGKHGIGVDNIDVAAARARGAIVVFTPGSNEEAVAEHALTLMLMLARRIELSIALGRAGRFEEGRRAAPGFDLRGKTLGLIGVGRIGGRVAQICRSAFDMTVVAYDPYAVAHRLRELGVSPRATVDEVVAEADVVSVHTPLTPETRGIVSAPQLARMKPHAIVINCARGGLIDEMALVDALRSGRIGGAGIDVFDPEPPPVDHPLLALPNAIVTPHVAGSSLEAAQTTARMVAEETLRVLRGDAPRWPVGNESSIPRRRLD